MKKNMGNADRGVRLVIGLSLFVWGYLNSNVWGLVGIVPVLTAFVSFCPLYAPFGFNTCHKNKRELS